MNDLKDRTITTSNRKEAFSFRVVALGCPQSKDFVFVLNALIDNEEDEAMKELSTKEKSNEN